jgi:peptidoglycan/LPS O-acetylase OafA/YrhL
MARRSHGRRSEHGSTFRPDVEGLRAVAVLLVVLFHADLGPFNGGFVGVDVFFVLSGYLITGLLLRELDATGSISLAGFYARRVRRLLPAALLVLVATLVASVLLLPPLLVPSVAGDVAAAAAYVSNIAFAARATDYFAAGQAPSPVLHYWSLGVEEQFYLVWPAVLLLISRRVARGRRERLIGGITAITAMSLVLCVWLTATNQPLAFYLLPARAWELGVGGLIAVGAPQLATMSAVARAAMGWLGLGLIAAAGLLLTSSTPFPGTAAVLPVAGTVLVVIAGLGVAGRGPARWLGTAVPRFFGRISYSLYLWHWPVLVIPATVAGSELPIAARVGLVALSVVLAAATQRFLEAPIREGRLVGIRPPRNLAAAGAFSAIVVLLATGVATASTATLEGSGPSHPTSAAANQQAVDQLLANLSAATPKPSPTAKSTTRLGARPTPTRASTGARVVPPFFDTADRGQPTDRGSTSTPTPSALAVAAPTPTAMIAAAPLPSPTTTALPPRPKTQDSPLPANLLPSLVDAAKDYPESYLDGCHVGEQGGTSGTCLYGNLSSSTTIALFGDSHALAWFPALQRFAEEQGWRLLDLTMSTCNPATIPIWVPAWNRVSWECNVWRQQAIQRLIAVKPQILVVTGTRGFATTDPTGVTVLAGDQRTQAWVSGMQRTLSQLIPNAGTTILLSDTPLSLVDPPVCLSEHTNSTLACATNVEQAINPAWLGTERTVAAANGAQYIDPQLWVCPSSPCPVVLGNFLIDRDQGHLTATFAEALADKLGNAILAAVQRRQAATP